MHCRLELNEQNEDPMKQQKRDRKEKTIVFKLDAERNQWLRSYQSESEKRYITTTVLEALDLLRTRARIENYIRASVRANWAKYETSDEFIREMMDSSAFQLWRVGVPTKNIEDWIFSETYLALAEWHRRGANEDALARVLETEYFIPKETYTEPIPFEHEPEAENAAPAEAPKRKATARRKAEATA